MPPAPDPARAFRLTLDLCEAGVRLMRQNLRRTYSVVDESEIDELLKVWLRDRPGARHGDSPGRPVASASRLG